MYKNVDFEKKKYKNYFLVGKFNMFNMFTFSSVKLKKKIINAT